MLRNKSARNNMADAAASYVNIGAGLDSFNCGTWDAGQQLRSVHLTKFSHVDHRCDLDSDWHFLLLISKRAALKRRP